MEDDFKIFWDEAVNKLRKNELSEEDYSFWFEKMNYKEFQDNSVIITVPSEFFKKRIEQKFQKLIEDKLEDLIGSKISIGYEINKTLAAKPIQDEVINDSKKIEPDITDSKTEIRKIEKHKELQERYIFSNFVIGENNSFAANAAMAIADNPGNDYNPFLIYGSVGLGKTHLIQAIGNAIHMKDPSKKIKYIKAETFTDHFIRSINTNSQSDFKKQYRNIDVLLIDDIHHFQGKKGTQEELFYTFDALYDSKKCLIFTCDRPPSELKEFNERLRNRFSRGLNVDLQPPNFETKMAILRKMLQNANKDIYIDDEILEYISKIVVSNIRDLEAALTKIIGYADLVKKEITMDLAQNLLKQFFTSEIQSKIPVEKIQKEVADFFNITTTELKGPKKIKKLTFPRQIAMYIIRELTDLSTTEIGLEFGGRDHSTVMYGCQKISDKIISDPSLEPIINDLIRTIRGA